MYVAVRVVIFVLSFTVVPSEFAVAVCDGFQVIVTVGLIVSVALEVYVLVCEIVPPDAAVTVPPPAGMSAQLKFKPVGLL